MPSSNGSVVDPASLDFPYPHTFPYSIHPFIENWVNVEGDGNYGVRVVSYLIYGIENQWSKVHK